MVRNEVFGGVHSAGSMGQPSWTQITIIILERINNTRKILTITMFSDTALNFVNTAQLMRVDTITLIP